MITKAALYITLMVLLTSCAKDVQSCKRDTTSKRNYVITVYSGGKPIHTDTLRDKILNEEAGNGMYYYKGDTLVELSGDYVIKSVN
jgi:hypothetical protein